MAKRKTKSKKSASIEVPVVSKNDFLIGFIVAAFAFLLYANTLGHQYALDDDGILVNNSIVQQGISGIGELATTHYRAGYINWQSTPELYRPIPLILLATLWEISPDHPEFYHLVNVFLYALTGFLLFITFRRIGHRSNRLIPLLATFIFVAHPVHTEVVANIKSIDEILGFLFSIAALNYWWKYLNGNKVSSLIISVLLYFLAMFSKENGITFLAVFPLTYWFFGNKFSLSKISKSAVFLLPVGIYLLARKGVIGTVATKKIVSVLDNAIAAANGTGEQLATAILFIGQYLKTLCFPIELNSDLGYSQIPITDFTDWRVWIILGLIVGALVFAVKSAITKKSWMAYGILFFTICFSIYANIVLLIGTSYGERLLYAASFGFSLFLVDAVFKAFKSKFSVQNSLFDSVKNNPIPTAIIGFIVLFYAFQTITRNPVWYNSFTLYEADIVTAPNSAKLNYHYGLELSKKGDDATDQAAKNDFYQKGNTHLQKAVELYPTYGDAYGRIGLTAYHQKDYQTALSQYEKSLKHKPNSATVNSNKGTLLFEMSRVLQQQGKSSQAADYIQQAKSSYQKAVEINPAFVDGWRNLGSLEAQTGNFQNAITAFSTALKYQPNDPILNFYLGSAYLDSGNEAAGRPYLNKAYQLKPDLPRK